MAVARLALPMIASLLFTVSAMAAPKELRVVRGSGSRANMIQTLRQHGDFEALRAFSEGSPRPRVGRPIPTATLRNAVSLWGPGLRREVHGYVGPGVGGSSSEPRMTPLRVEGDGPSADVDADLVYDQLGAVFGFYRSQYGRNSLDDRGAPLRAVVHYRKDPAAPWNNASYAKGLMRFGDGDGQTSRTRAQRETTGHELSHGVNRTTAKLGYDGESGALNESFSDVMAKMIDQWRLHQTVSEADWRYGVASIPAGNLDQKALRNFADPHDARKPQPAHIREFRRVEPGQESDRKAVHEVTHLNSGIPNRAFYGAATRAGGYAWETVGKVWYVTWRDYLPSDASFEDAARLTVQVAGRLFGEGSPVQRSVIAGWRDVGISTPLPREGASAGGS